MLRITGVLLGEARGAHIDLGTHAEPGGKGLAVNVEHDALALTEHAEHRSVKCVARQLVLIEVRVADDGAIAGDWVVGLDHALQRGDAHG